MDLLDAIDFDGRIPNEILDIVYGHCSLRDILTLMQVNQRWKDVSIYHLQNRTKFNYSDLLDPNDQILKGDKKQRAKKKSKFFEESKQMLELMPKINNLEINFGMIQKGNWMLLIQTIVNCNPLIEELTVIVVNQKILKKIVTKFGPQIKVLSLSYSKFTHVTGSIFKVFPNLEVLKLYNCKYTEEFLLSIPETVNTVFTSGDFNDIIRRRRSYKTIISQQTFSFDRQFYK